MKNDASTQRKSGFNRQRACYLSSDGKHYCYEVWNSEQHRMVKQELTVGEDLSEEWTIFLDESDHDIDLNDRYQRELRDALFDSKVDKCGSDNKEDNIDPWEKISSNVDSPENVLFAEKVPENPNIAKVRRIIDEDCSDSQKEFIFSHFGECHQLEEMRQEEAEQTGKAPTSQAMTNRKNKIVDKVAKAFGVERVKRHRYPKKD